MNSVITLTTDFGISDPYVAVMKGVILTVNPAAVIIDLTHHIAPQNLVQAAWTIKAAFSFFPPGTVHVIVVDPGVGTDRRIIAFETEKYIFLAPDNGILTLLMDELENGCVYHINNPDYFLEKISRTFHGRDVFAPVAAHITKGVRVDEMGTKIHAGDPVRLDMNRPRLEDDGALTGSIIGIDRFGNLTTNISRELLGRSFQEFLSNNAYIKIKGKGIQGLSESYQSADKGEPVAVIGSSGFLEIAINCGNATSFYQASEGDRVTVCARDCRPGKPG
jgi:S-adenosylmethionine hydrolase